MSAGSGRLARIPVATLLRIIVFLSSTAFVLMLAVVYLLLAGPTGTARPAGLDPEVKRLAVERLVAESSGLYDSHPDSDVGRVLMPTRETRAAGARVRANRQGVRDRDLEAKAPGTFRVVLLGDSMVYGLGVEVGDRTGPQLEEFFRELNPTARVELEVLHIGIPSWNIQAQTSFLRRQLSLLEPDLVVQIMVPNDLDDTTAVRGFGEAASFSSQWRRRADGMVSSAAPLHLGLGARLGLLRLGLDHESRQRYRVAARRLARLRDLVEEQGGAYAAMFQYRFLSPIALRQLATDLRPEQAHFFSLEFGRDRSLYVADNDPHWNREGHRRVALMIYALMHGQGLIADLEPSPDAQRVFDEVLGPGREQAGQQLTAKRKLRIFKMDPDGVIEIPFSSADASQIHGGVRRDGVIAPYASMVVRRRDEDELVIEGEFLDRPELRGAGVEVFLDAESLGEIEVGVRTSFRFAAAVPEALAGRSFLTVRLISDDYVYAGEDLRQMAVLKIDRVALGRRE